MPQEESKQVEDPINPPAPDETVDNGAPAASKKKSKKKSGKGKKAAVSSGNDNEGSSTGTAAASSRPGNGISSKLVHEILKNNTSLTSEMQGIDPKEAEEMVKRMKLEEILTGMVCCAKLHLGVKADGEFHRLLVGRTRRTWQATSSGKHNRWPGLVRFRADSGK